MRQQDYPLFMTPEETSRALSIPVRTVYEKIRQRMARKEVNHD